MQIHFPTHHVNYTDTPSNRKAQEFGAKRHPVFCFATESMRILGYSWFLITPILKPGDLGSKPGFIICWFYPYGSIWQTCSDSFSSMYQRIIPSALLSHSIFEEQKNNETSSAISILSYKYMVLIQLLLEIHSNGPNVMVFGPKREK